MTAKFISRLLEVIEKEVIPLTRIGVNQGNKVFGAAILKKADLSLVVAGTNAETQNPLWHGEMSTIKKLYELPAAQRIAPKDCIFLSTHEPCSMCLSAITWGGYDNFYYLFGYEQTKDTFNIPHDLRILKEVFNCENGSYTPENSYWKSNGIVPNISQLKTKEQKLLNERVGKINKIYTELSTIYQVSKLGNDIPLA